MSPSSDSFRPHAHPHPRRLPRRPAPPDRKAALTKLRAVINKNLPAGFKEGIQYGMIGWTIPLTRYPDTYNGQPLQLAAIASQKKHMALYLACVYGDESLSDWFREAWKATGKKLDMGKSCVRFRSIDDVPLEVVGQAIAKVGVDGYIASYEAVRAQTKAGKKSPTKKSPAKKSPTKKSPTKKSPTKKSPAKKSPTKKSPTKKSPTKKSPTKKSPTKKSPAKKSAAKKSPAKKPGAKKSPAKKSAAKKSPAKKPGAKKSPTTK